MEKLDKCPRCGNTQQGEYLWECRECKVVFCSSCEGGGHLTIKCPACEYEAGTLISPARIGM